MNVINVLMWKYSDPGLTSASDRRMNNLINTGLDTFIAAWQTFVRVIFFLPRIL